MEVAPEIAVPNHFSIAAELLMNSIDSGASQISINFDLYHNIISCKDNSQGIPPSIFQRILKPCQKQQSDITSKKIFQRKNYYLSLISQIADIDIQTKTEKERIPRRITKGRQIISAPLLSCGTEIIVSSIFANNRIRLNQISDTKTKNESLFKLKQFLNTISLNFIDIKFTLNNTTIANSKTLEERWRVISGTFLKITSDNHITYFKSSFNIGFQLPFTPFIANNFPVVRLLIDGREMKQMKNSITVINTKMYEITQIYWSNDGLVCEMATASTKTRSLTPYLTFVSNNEIAQMKVIGIFLNSYIICNHEDTIYAVDQHAAHERINLENLLDNISDPFPSHELKVPLKLPIDPDHTIPSSVIKIAKRWGWSISKSYFSNANDKKFYSQNSLFSSTKTSLNWCLFSIPRVETYLVDDVEGFLSYINKLERNELFCATRDQNENENDPLIDQIPECLMHALQTRACRKSIKFGDIISNERAQSLIIELSKCKRPNDCAHGRTVVAPISNLKNRYIQYTHLK